MYELDILKERFLEYSQGVSFEDENMISAALDFVMPKTDYEILQYAANNPEQTDEPIIEYIKINIK